MKFFKFRKMMSVIVSVCLLAEIFTWNAVSASAAELPDPAESTGGQEETYQTEVSGSVQGDQNRDSGSEDPKGAVTPEEKPEDTSGQAGTEEQKPSELPDAPADSPEAADPDAPSDAAGADVPDTGETTETDGTEKPEEPSGTGAAEEPEEPSETEPEKPSETEPAEEPEKPSETEPAEEPEKPSETEPAENPEEPSQTEPAENPEESPETEGVLGEVTEEDRKLSASETSRTAEDLYATSGNFANIVLFVGFQNTDHSGHESMWGQCFMKDAEYTFKLFNGDAQYPRGMREYLANISYGQLELANMFPQYDKDTGEITPYLLEQNEEYYYNNDSAMIVEAVRQMQEKGQMPRDVEVDRNGDLMVDNLTIVVPCESNGRNARFFGHKADFPGTLKINEKFVGKYNVIPEYDAYLGMSSQGVIIHEFLHSAGYPDLYRENAELDAGRPVGSWDIMANTSLYVQYPLAYLRGVITGWFRIPEVRESVSGMSLYAASASTRETSGQQAVILKTEYSDTEFFVLEYRKMGARASSVDYDCKIPGSGLIIYRVDLTSETNFRGKKDMIYLFRPGDSYDENHRERGGGDLSTSFLSAESGRTSYGTHDPGKSLSDGAITFSDGTNSGIVISNVGSASGDQITFDITYAEVAEEDYWKSVSVHGRDDPSYSIASFMDADGALYYLQQKEQGSSRPAYLYRYKDSGWESYSSVLDGNVYDHDHHLEKFNGSFYVGYVKDNRARLVRWNGSRWETVYTSAESVNSLDMAADATGIYLAFTSSDNKKLYVYQYNGAKAAAMGNQAASAEYVANPSITVENGKAAVMYQDFWKGNLLNVRLFDSADNTWKTAGNLDLCANSGILRMHGNRLYLLKNGQEFGKNESYLYVYDLSGKSGEWSRVGNDFYANESIVEMDLFFQGDTPYIAYQGGATQAVYVMTLEGGNWIAPGGKVTGEHISGLRAYLRDGTVYVTYLSMVSDQVYIKSHAAGHDYRKTSEKAASCKGPGAVTYSCADCQNTYTETIPQLTTHKYSAWTTKYASTCKAAGTKTRKCTVCGKTETAPIAKLTTHRYGSWTTTRASTCKTEGTKTRKCSVCGKTETAVIAKKAHTPGPAATCTRAQTCKVCRTVLKKATGHRHTKTVTTAATFLKTGLRKTVCRDCGAVTAKKTLAKISCKKGQVYTVGNYKYRIISPKTNGTGTVSFEGLAKNVSKVTVGDTVIILGTRFRIVAISDKALKNKTGITSVTIGRNVQTIGKEAFYGAKKLKTITISSTNITKVGANALKNIHAGANIKVPKSKLSKYRSLFRNKGQKSTVKILLK